MKNQISIHYYKTPCGELILGSFNEELCIADWRFRKKREAVDQRIQAGLSATYVEESSTVIENTKSQLLEYFNNKRTQFDIPLKLVGSDFQQQVWNQLQKIPFGETLSYLGLSKELGNEKAIRAVAAANGANAISILVPCHRIIGSDGKLIGYAGGIASKKKLLQLEGSWNKSQLDLFD